MKVELGDEDINIHFGIPGGGVVVLTIAFVVLKALGYLTWSWLWVFSPLWIGVALVVFILIVVSLIILVAVRRV